MTLKSVPVYTLAIPLLLLTVFVMSLVLGSFYLEGDQAHYRAVYEGLQTLSLTEGYKYYFEKLSSLEYTHYLLSWLASRVIGKDLFIALTNTLFAWIMLLLLRKWRVSVYIAALMVLANFYVLVLYFPAERLKFGIMFLFLSLLYAERTKLFYLFAFIAVVSHVQIVLVYCCMFACLFKNFFVRVITSGRVSIKFFAVMIVALVPIALMAEQLFTKLGSYMAARDVSDLLRIIVFFALALWYSRNRSETVMLFIPLCVAVLLVGGERINMFGYFVFLYYALRVRRGVNVGIVATSLYFIYASFGFVSNIISYGDGFY